MMEFMEYVVKTWNVHAFYAWHSKNDSNIKDRVDYGNFVCDVRWYSTIEFCEISFIFTCNIQRNACTVLLAIMLLPKEKQKNRQIQMKVCV